MIKTHTLHVDMGGKLYRNEVVAIAYISAEDKKFHGGIVLSKSLVKDLVKKNEGNKDFSQLYAIFIYWMLRKNTNKIKDLIICNDEPYEEVIKYLRILFEENEYFSDIGLSSIAYDRKKFGKPLSSLADGRANSYRKRGLQKHRWYKGVSLNVIPFNYFEICELWDFIDKKLKE